ncbi:MAG TPA: type II toxin-antitoxin system PemK/MazF family toxin [Candidatus Saccharimonadales bacterium]|nr:type II toxin-antitoxin system PemK/MazF family toxin [Candidatus Saccharimonadales bacterium]
MVGRGQIWWVDLSEPLGSEPGYTRPVVIVQADVFNRSRISTVMAIVITSNVRLAEAPGNVLLLADKTGLKKDSVANVSQTVTIDKRALREQVGELDNETMRLIDEGMRLALGL